jgi:COP9 signalosome complex subunit 1
MALNVEQSTFFQEQKTKGVLIVKEAPKFDLEPYISNYSGMTRANSLRRW